MTESIFRNKNSSVKLPERHGEPQHREYFREHSGAILCPECGNVHFEKAWHHSGSVPPEHIEGKGRPETRKAMCPACMMAKDGLYEGEATLEGFPSRFDDEILHLFRGFGSRAVSLDPQDRILEIRKKAGKWRVRTTENQLSTKIAKKVRDTFNTVELNISHSKEPYEVERIRAVFWEK